MLLPERKKKLFSFTIMKKTQNVKSIVNNLHCMEAAKHPCHKGNCDQCLSLSQLLRSDALQVRRVISEA